jgi:hypothetical protein
MRVRIFLYPCIDCAIHTRHQAAHNPFCICVYCSHNHDMLKLPQITTHYLFLCIELCLMVGSPPAAITMPEHELLLISLFSNVPRPLSSTLTPSCWQVSLSSCLCMYPCVRVCYMCLLARTHACTYAHMHIRICPGRAEYLV